MKPIRFEYDVPVFSSRDIDDYGMPEHHGYLRYIVVESREANLVTDYKMEHAYDLIPIHRYSRLARFKSTLLKLLGEKTKIPDTVIDACKYLNKDTQDLWNATRKILKENKWSIYYDFIPAILSRLGLYPMLKITSQKFEEILNDYRSLCTKFEQTKHLHKRRYFPNIRFIVLKLLEHHGCLHDYPIPFVRTDRKLLSLNLLWDNLTRQA
jgi:hypothetical protein